MTDPIDDILEKVKENQKEKYGLDLSDDDFLLDDEMKDFNDPRDSLYGF